MWTPRIPTTRETKRESTCVYFLVPPSYFSTLLQRCFFRGRGGVPVVGARRFNDNWHFPRSRWGRWEWRVSSTLRPGPLLSHFLPLSSGSWTGAGVARRRVQPLRGSGSVPLARSHPRPAFLVLVSCPHLVLASFPLPRFEALAGQPGKQWRPRPPREPKLGRRIVLAAAAPPLPSANSASPDEAPA